MAKPRVVIDPAVAAQIPPQDIEAQSGPEVEPVESVAFVNNGNPIVKLKDGTEFRFPKSLFVTADVSLIKKIVEVMDSHGIVFRDANPKLPA